MATIWWPSRSLENLWWGTRESHQPILDLVDHMPLLSQQYRGRGPFYVNALQGTISKDVKPDKSVPKFDIIVDVCVNHDVLGFCSFL